MPYLDNVLLTTSRPGYTPATGKTSSALTSGQSYLTNVPGYITAAHQQKLPVHLITGGFDIPYTVLVGPNYDIGEGDLIIAITLLDGLTPWPNDTPARSSSNAATQHWTVVYVKPSAPGFLAHLTLYLSRTLASGPWHR